MKELKMQDFGLTPLTSIEAICIDGGDTGYYGKGVDLNLAWQRFKWVNHQVGDFVRGFLSGLD